MARSQASISVSKMWADCGKIAEAQGTEKREVSKAYKWMKQQGILDLVLANEPKAVHELRNFMHLPSLVSPSSQRASDCKLIAQWLGCTAAEVESVYDKMTPRMRTFARARKSPNTAKRLLAMIDRANGNTSEPIPELGSVLGHIDTTLGWIKSVCGLQNAKALFSAAERFMH